MADERYHGPPDKADTAVFFERGCSGNERWLSVANREHPFQYEGEMWDSVQQCYEAQKFPEQIGHRARIRAARTAEEVAVLGREREFLLPKEWRPNRRATMQAIALAQAEAHKELSEYLISVHDRWLQCTETFGSRNKFWYGPKNEMGHVWMHVSTKCKERAAATLTESSEGRYISLRERPTFVVSSDGSPKYVIQPSGTYVRVEYNPRPNITHATHIYVPWRIPLTVKQLSWVGPPIDLHQPGKIYVVDRHAAREREMLPELDDVDLGCVDLAKEKDVRVLITGGGEVLSTQRILFIGRKGDVEPRNLEPTEQLLARRARGEAPE